MKTYVMFDASGLQCGEPVSAYTKGEARAKLKKRLGLGRGERLAVGVVLKVI